MSISWNVETRIPVDPHAFLNRLNDVVNVVLGAAPESLRLTEDKSDASGNVWCWPPQGASSAPWGAGDVFATLSATVAGMEMRCGIAAGPAIEDDGTLVPGSTYAEIEALRTQTSVAFGLATALALALTTQGDIGGTGVDHTTHPGVPDLLDAFKRPQNEPSITKTVQQLAARLGSANLPLQ
jgi:hypothetical protein